MLSDDRKARPLTRRRFLATSALAAGAAATTGALLGTDRTARVEAAQDRATTTLQVMYYSGPQELTTDAIQQFERQNPGVAVRFIAYDPIRLSASLAAGEPPDFIRTIGATEMPSLIARGLCANLDSYFAKSRVLHPADLQPINDVYRYDGKAQGVGPRYGMAKDWSLDNSLWYNKAVFDRAGVPYPSASQPLTYDELFSLAKRLTVRAKGVTQVYGVDMALDQGHLEQMLRQDGQSLFNHDFSEVDFTTPEARRALTFFVDLAQAHVTPSPLDPNPAGWDYPPFLANRLGMANYGYWFGSLVNIPGPHGQPVARSGYAPSPQFGHTRVDACLTGTGAWIPQASHNKDLAFTFMEFFLGGAPAVTHARLGTGIPALKSLVPDLPHDTPYQNAAYQAMRSELSYFGILHFSPYISNDAMNASITKYITPVMQGKTSLESAAQDLTRAVNQLLSLGKDQVS